MFAGVFAAGVGVILVVAPLVYLSLYVAEPTPEMTFAAQRLGPAIAGLGVLLFLARDLPAGRFAIQFATVAALVWIVIAATGVFHFLTGVATQAILIAAATEVAMAALFLIAAREKQLG